MNVELVNPSSLLRALDHDATSGARETLWARLGARVREEVRYLQARAVLSRLDDRDLDDLALGRGDLPALARRHARADARR
jgi:uncharacterized protein YjiS (DUF1127 family)